MVHTDDRLSVRSGGRQLVLRVLPRSPSGELSAWKEAILQEVAAAELLTTDGMLTACLVSPTEHCSLIIDPDRM